ncbi:PAS domain S-box protein [Desulfogranum marinum]|uniref:hybrid sensor histidine kinase/response regulator n=1 Tax=Desulfogranum marinum TaxID=453220 RepID=UPI0029C8CCE8|nr:PAS domain S-box protein [Desulfogranum marinum]
MPKSIVFSEHEKNKESKIIHCELLPVPYQSLDMDGNILEVNQLWLKTLGYSREEIIGTSFVDIIYPEDIESFNAKFSALQHRGTVLGVKFRIFNKNGTIIWFSFEGTCEEHAEDGSRQIHCLLFNITEQKTTEERLRESENKFFLAFDASPDAININRLEDGLYIDVNKGFTELTGFTKDDIFEKTSLDINIWHDPLDRQRLVQSLQREGVCENIEVKFRKKDGSVTTTLMSAKIISLENTPHILSITRDISKLRAAERQILEQNILFETMFNAIDDGVVITDTDRKILYANKGMEKTFGYLPEELRGKTTKILYAASDAYQTAGKRIFGKDAQQEDKVYVTSYKHRSGKEFPGETFGVKLYDQNDKWIGNLGVMRDVSKRMERKAERDRLIAAIEQTRDAIVITDKDAKIKYVNPAFEIISGYTSEEVFDKNPRILKSDEQDASFYQDLWQTLNSGQTFKGRMVNKRKDGDFFTEEATISPVFDPEGQLVHFIAVKRDITEQISLESQLQQAQKMEAVGRLTGGVAHDFNNILGVIIGYTEMALEDVDPKDNLYGLLGKILNAAERSATIVRQLLAFSRKQTISPKVIDLNSAVANMLQMLHRLIGENIDLTWVPDSDTLIIKIDPSQIDQILANLCVNAKDSITGSGNIIIETARVTFDQEYCADHFGFYPGEFIQLSVSDNGCGIDKENQEHIFEPFFTTKGLGDGTGLGLSMVYGIVKQNGGFINLYSEPNKGTTFKLYFPSCDEENRKTGKVITSSNRKSWGETILLVEDDLTVLAMTQKMLEKIGYSILPASRPSEAIQIAEDYSGDIDLVFTDVVMPEMTGKEMAERIKPLYPNVSVLFTSGYTANVIAHNGILDEGVQFIQKPFSLDQLAHTLQSILS